MLIILTPYSKILDRVVSTNFDQELQGKQNLILFYFYF